MGDRPGIVWVIEEFDREDVWMLSARFSASWRSTGGEEFVDGPESMTVLEAIEWGRSKADVVLVRLEDSDVHWSAGRRQPDETQGFTDPLPVWSNETRVERRRCPGYEHLDLVTEHPIDWEVVVRPPRLHSERHTESVREALEVLPGLGRIHVSVEEDGEPGLVARFVVSARSHPEAVRLAVDAASDLMQAIAPKRPTASGLEWVSLGLSPTDDVRPAAR
jgi:hypothetical protein